MMPVGDRVLSVSGPVMSIPRHGTGDSVAKDRAFLSVGLSTHSTKKWHVSTRLSDGGAPQKRHLGAERRRALQLLASIPFGATETIMLAHHGFKRRTLADLVHAGLATIERAGASTEGKAIAAGRIRITAAGRSALED
jgi:hypothetical protein